MSDPNTPISDLRVKAFSIGKDFEDSKNWSDMTPEEIDLAFHLLPTNAQKSLRESGSPDTYYDPSSADGQNRNAPNLRGRLALFMWAKQGGRDGYSLSGMQRSPGEFQVEHIKDMSSGGQDTASNFVMLYKRVNQPRSSYPLPKFISQATERAKKIHENLAEPSGEFLKQRQNSLQQRGLYDAFDDSKSPLKGGTIGDLINSNFYELIIKKQSGLPDEIKTSREQFSSFADSIINDLGGKTDVSLGSLSRTDLDKILENASKHLGVDSSKIVDYLGRTEFNNYHDGNRFTRGGTNQSPAGLTSLENRLLGKPQSISDEEYNAQKDQIKKAHENVRAARERIRTGGGTSAELLEAVSESLHFLSGRSKESPEWFRDRSPSTRDIMNVFDVYLKNFAPERPVGNNASGIYLSAALAEYKLDVNQVMNYQSIKNKKLREQAEKTFDTLNLLDPDWTKKLPN